MFKIRTHCRKVLGNKKLIEFYIRDHSYCFLDKLIDINDLVFKNLKVDKKPYQDFFTDHVRYEVSDVVKLFYIIFPKINGCIKDDDHHKSKYLKMNRFNEENKDILKNIKKHRIKLNIQLIRKNIMQIFSIVGLSSDDNLSLEKKLKMCNLVVLIICDFNDGNDDKYYDQVFEEECLYK